MTTRPDDGPPSGHVRAGHVRAGHADREHVIEALKTAFVRGQLAKEEFDARVAQAFASRTYAELATLTADIPAGSAAAGPAMAGPPRPPARPQDQTPPTHPVRTAAIVSAGCLIFAALSFLIGGSIDRPITKLFILVAFLAVMGVPLMIACAVSAVREQRRSRRQYLVLDGAGILVAPRSEARD